MFVITETGTFFRTYNSFDPDQSITTKLLIGFYATQLEAEQRIKEISAYTYNEKKTFVIHSLTPIKSYSSTDFK
jgi:hypothetical protein